MAKQKGALGNFTEEASRNVGKRPIGSMSDEELDYYANTTNYKSGLPEGYNKRKSYAKGGLVKKACARGMGAAVRGGGYNP